MDSSVGHLAVYFLKNPGTILLADSIFAATLRAPYVLVSAWSFFHLLSHLRGPRKSVSPRTLAAVPFIFAYTVCQALSLTHVPLAALAAFRAAGPLLQLPVALFSQTYHRFSVLLLLSFALMSTGLALALWDRAVWAALGYVASEWGAEWLLGQYRTRVERAGEQESEFVTHAIIMTVSGFLSLHTHQLSSVTHRLTSITENILAFVVPWVSVRLALHAKAGHAHRFLPLDYAPLADSIAMAVAVGVLHFSRGGWGPAGVGAAPVVGALVALLGRTMYTWAFASLEEDFE